VLVRPRRITPYDDRPGFCLHHHQADRVRQDVMHVPGHPGALLGRRTSRLGEPFTLELLGSLTQGLGMLAMAPLQRTQQERGEW
jgi:hypothetical protein